MTLTTSKPSFLKDSSMPLNPSFIFEYSDFAINIVFLERKLPQQSI